MFIDFRHPSFAPDNWDATQNVDRIPLLETMGEYEAAGRGWWGKNDK
jgi:hypothetical protein